MKYKLKWKILLWNKWIYLIFIVSMLSYIYVPVKTICYSLSYINVPLADIYKEMCDRSYFFFVIVFCFNYLLISRERNVAKDILWIANRKTFYKGILFFSFANVMINFAILSLIEVGLWIGFGKNDIVFLIKSIEDIFVYYVLSGIIAILFSTFLSFIKYQTFSILIGIAVLFMISPIAYNIDGSKIHWLQKWFHIMPQGIGYWLNNDSGDHWNMFSLALICLWKGLLLVLILLCVKSKRILLYIFSGLMMVGGLWMASKPHVERYDVLMDNPDDNQSIYYAVDRYCNIFREETNEDVINALNYSISKYEMNIKIDWQLHNQVKLYLEGEAGSYDFTLYNRYEITDVRDKDGNKLKYFRDDDYLTVEVNRDNECIIIDYKGVASPCQADYDSIRLYAGMAWYPVPGKQIVQDINTETYEGLYVNNIGCKNVSTDYDICISSIHEVYCNLPGDNSRFRGRTDLLMISGGMLENTVIDNVNYIYPRSLKYCHRYDNGIDDWFAFVQQFIDENNITFDETYYVFFGNESFFYSAYETGDNMIMLNRK